MCCAALVPSVVAWTWKWSYVAAVVLVLTEGLQHRVLGSLLLVLKPPVGASQICCSLHLTGCRTWSSGLLSKCLIVQGLHTASYGKVIQHACVQCRAPWCKSGCLGSGSSSAAQDIEDASHSVSSGRTWFAVLLKLGWCLGASSTSIRLKRREIKRYKETRCDSVISCQPCAWERR